MAPGTDLGIRQLLPAQDSLDPNLAWKAALQELEDRTMDVAIVPLDDLPTRFHKQKLYEEEFVIAAHKGHSFQRSPTLKRYCEMEHLVVSHTGDVSGFVDVELAKKNLARRVVLTVPNFNFALSVLAETEMVSALPRRFVEIHGARFNVGAIKPPLPLPRFSINIVLPKVAMMDAGLAWLVQLLGSIRTGSSVPRSGQRNRGMHS